MSDVKQCDECGKVIHEEKSDRWYRLELPEVVTPYMNRWVDLCSAACLVRFGTSPLNVERRRNGAPELPLPDLILLSGVEREGVHGITPEERVPARCRHGALRARNGDKPPVPPFTKRCPCCDTWHAMPGDDFCHGCEPEMQEIDTPLFRPQATEPL